MIRSNALVWQAKAPPRSRRPAPGPEVRATIRWVRGPDAENKAPHDLANLLEAELDELRREGLRLPER